MKVALLNNCYFTCSWAAAAAYKTPEFWVRTQGRIFLSKLEFLKHSRIKTLAFVTCKIFQRVYIIYPRKSGCSLAQISGKSEVRKALIQIE